MIGRDKFWCTCRPGQCGQSSHTYGIQQFGTCIAARDEVHRNPNAHSPAVLEGTWAYCSTSAVQTHTVQNPLLAVDFCGETETNELTMANVGAPHMLKNAAGLLSLDEIEFARRSQNAEYTSPMSHSRHQVSPDGQWKL